MTQGGHISVLIADDEPAHIEAIRRVFEAAGSQFAVKSAATLGEYRQLSAAEPPDIALLDLNFSDGSAVEVLKAPLGANLFPILIMTSHGDESKAVQAIKLGALDYIVKSPETFAGMPRAVERALREWRLILERGAAERSLRESEERYRGLFDKSHDALMTLEPPSWKFTSGNPAAVAMFGAKTIREFISFQPGELSPERQPDGRASSEKAREMIETAMREGSSFFEWMHKRISGEDFPATVLLTRTDAAGKRFLQATVRDITERDQLQKKLMTSEKLAVMGRLTADVAHELNNPLAVVIGGAQLLLDRFDAQTPAAAKSQVETVLRHAKRCKMILGSLLGYGRTIGEKEEIISLSDLIREVIKAVDYQYDMSGIDIVMSHDQKADMEIAGNTTALLSVFINVIRNARHAMGKKGRLAISIEKEDELQLRVKISDSGIGMSHEQLSKLFQPFASGWKDEAGSGIGLATSRGLVETHGGSMLAQSDGPGQGTTFTIFLPHALNRRTLK